MKEVIRTDKAPAAIGPYSQAIKVTSGNFLFISGQIPLDPATMEVTGKTASEQCQRVMDNLAAILKAAGADFGNVVKTTIYLSDMSDFGPVNQMYTTYFDIDMPARATVEVSRLPKDVKVEIDAIAAV
jgi:2-iminobutanoate/2-iminopropanoate deaminase